MENKNCKGGDRETESNNALFAFLLSDMPSSTKIENEISQTVADFKLLPKYGKDTGQNTSLSNVLQAILSSCAYYLICLDSIQNYAFEGKQSVQLNEMPDIAFLDERIISKSQVDSFIETAKSLDISFSRVKTLSKDLHRSMIEDGNAYLLMRIAVINGISKVGFEFIPYTDFMYETSDKYRDGVKTGIISKVFTADYLKKKTARRVVVSDMETTNIKKDGKVFETLFHFKQKAKNELYGHSVFENQKAKIYSDYQNDTTQYQIKKSALAAVAIYSAPAEPLTGANSGTIGEAAEQKKRAAFSAISKSSSPNSEQIILHDYYAVDGGRPQLFTIPYNRDTAYLQETTTQNANAICGLMQWTTQLAGIEKEASGFGDNRKAQELIIYNSKTILPTQQEWEANWSHVFTKIGEVLNLPIFKECTIKFPQRIDTVVAQISKLNANPKNATKDTIV